VHPLFCGVRVVHLSSFVLCCSIRCLYVLSSVLWCPLRFLHKTMFGSSILPVVCRRVHVLLYFSLTFAYTWRSHFKESVEISLTSLTRHVCWWLFQDRTGISFKHIYAVVMSVFNNLRWEIEVRFLFGGIGNHHCLNFLFIIQSTIGIKPYHLSYLSRM
jgi:hypothetical protein